MSDHRREIRVDKWLTAREMHEPNAVAFQDVAGELCLDEGSGMPRRHGQSVAGEAAETAARVAGVGNGEVAGSGTTIPNGTLRHFPDRGTLWYSASHSGLRSRRTSRGSDPRPLKSLSSGRDALLEGSILGLPGLIEEKPAEQARSCPGCRTEPRVPADRAKYGAAAGADGRAGQRALLGRGHIGTSSDRQSDGREQQ
jgi:hypothetical protein